jgi:predicted enzyme related to lactoylglutathione lyase
MAIDAKYVHTNIVSDNWEQLAKFYEKVFGCKRLLPERDMSGKWIEDGTGVTNAHIRGAHLRLPGYGDTGPTIEIFEYDQNFRVEKARINQPGFTHIAFLVDDVGNALKEVLSEGGGQVGSVVKKEFPQLGLLTFVYASDPDGNIIELQNWKR